VCWKELSYETNPERKEEPLNPDRIGSFFWLVFGLLSMGGSAQLGLGTLRDPGSGFSTFLAGSFISVVALGLFLRSFLPGKTAHLEFSALWGNLNWRRPLAVGILLVVYTLALERVGFLPTSIFILFAMFKGVEKFSWVKAVLLSVCIPVASFIIFVVLLKTTLPRGIWGF